ncbi:MsnO8 family LLM class oxidoreductase [Amycolatopsis sp. GM8]|uniref:MsnO8 family LLM class oxidoreductase n=1 Tax=Amycolatopsis sp. GM8 TaxID=2896530 RepID=UPI001EFF768A|nr:MsnO8 family LLM class oxidoreductase [Amycolatopsis sp. GM8]
MSDAISVAVHDTVPVWRTDAPGDALRRTIDLATAVEELGYRRYWVAEHHSTPALATSVPAVLAGQILAATRTMRVGSGAVLLPNHPALTVAEEFGLLESLYPGRVDLGLGRASGGAPAAAARLGDPRRLDFDAQLTELSGYFFNRGNDIEGVRAVPEPASAPHFWMVGSSTGSAAYAGRHGLPYVYAHSIVPGPAPAALAAYRDAFEPSSHLSEPYAGVAAVVVLADTDEQARAQAEPFVLGQILMRTVDHDTVLPTEQETAAHRYTAEEELFRRGRLDPQFIGSPATVAPGLQSLLAETGADELFALTQVPSHDARIRSYELLAKVIASMNV